MRKMLAQLLILLLPALLFAQTKAASPAHPLVFTHVTVIDVTAAPSKSDMTVIVAGNRIEAVGKTGKLRVPRDAQIIDASGKSLIPGLWDMHIHSGSYDQGRKYSARLVAIGVTGIRDMGTPLDDILRLRKEVDEGKFIGPRMIVCGPLLEGPLPPNLASMTLLRGVNNESEAEEAVRYLKARGVDFIKVDDSFPREAYFAVAADAKRQGIPFAGHIPPFITAAEASDAGQRSIEHLGGVHYAVLLACSTRESELHAKVKEIMQAEIDAAFGKGKADETSLYRASLTKLLLESFSDEKAEALFERFVKNNTWQVPTLVTLKGLRDRNDIQDTDIQAGVKLKQKELELTRAMQHVGVGLMAGTDAPPDRANIHDELAMLVQAGLTPKETLQTATINPAKYLHRQDSLGSIERGKLADLVLLEANPLEDISNTKRIAAIVVNGRYLSKDSLQKMLTDIGKAANKK